MRLSLSFLPLLFSVVLAQNYSVTISGTPSHSIPPTLYGWMYEDISSGDGGLYGELLQNRAFQQVVPNTPDALNAWSAVNGASIAVINSTTPVSSALPNSLQVSIGKNATGAVGVANSGYWGINVQKGWTYTASFFYKVPVGSTAKGVITVSLKSSAGAVLASTTVTLNNRATNWTSVEFKLQPSATAPDTNNAFTVTVDGASAVGQTIYFAMFSLFPPTYKNRPNGMRLDIAQTLADTKPGFFRFPGGNNLGQSIAQRWKWRNTVGPLVSRPGRLGDWSYINTDGLGLKEYLDFIEDVGMESIMAVWAGYALDGEVAPESQLTQYIQEAADQINFVIGDPAKSEPAALRASLGHPEPYPLKWIEVGNEDFFNSGPYASYRWRDFVGNLSAKFPTLQFLATTTVNSPILTPKPALYDVHVYQTPGWFAQNVFYYDTFARDGTKYFEGEYAAISTNPNNLFGAPSQGRLVFPTVEGTTGEVAFMTGLERNSDIVFAASYAPLLENVANSQWTPDLISFNANTVVKSTSYYVQKLFSLNKGDVYLPSTLPSQTGTVFWSVTRRNATSEVLIKISNTNGNTAAVTFNLPYNTVDSLGHATVLTGAQTASNTMSAPDTVVPATSTFTAGKSFKYNVPGWSVVVLNVVAK